MARSRTSKFDAPEAVTNELIRIIERGVLPWRKPWTTGGSARPLRHNSEPHQGVNNFLLTMRTVMAGYTRPLDPKTLPTDTARNDQSRNVKTLRLLHRRSVSDPPRAVQTEE